MRPPAARNCRITSAQVSRAAMSSPTLKVRELPRPITGMASPLDGIGLLMSVSRLVAFAPGTRALAQSAAIPPPIIPDPITVTFSILLVIKTSCEKSFNKNYYCYKFV